MAQITDPTGTHIADVDSSGALKSRLVDQYGNPLTLPQAANLPTTQVGMMMAGRNDQSARLMRLDRMGNQRSGADQMLFYENVLSATLNVASSWTSAATSMTASSSVTAGILLNASALTTASAYISLLTQKYFTKSQMAPLHCRLRAQIVPAVNSTVDIGFYWTAGNTVPGNSAATFRWNTAGQFVPYVTFNSADIAVGSDISSLVSSTNLYTYDIVVDDDNVIFTVQDTSTGNIISEQTLQLPKTTLKLFSNGALTAGGRVINSASAPATAPILRIAEMYVRQVDSVTNKPWPHAKAAMGHGGEWIPSTSAASLVFANNTAPTSATLSGTSTSNAYLGGQFQFAAVAGSEVDYALFSYIVPLNGMSFICTGIHIHVFNMGAAVSGTPTLLDWSLVPNASALSLATAGLTRVPVGAQSLPVGSAVGYAAQDINVDFATPLNTNQGRYLTVVLRMPVGTATASQIIRGAVTLKGYWE